MIALREILKERSTQMMIRWWRQPAGQHKLTEVQCHMNNFNRAFSKCWFRNFHFVLARDQHYDVINWSDYHFEKSITISLFLFCSHVSPF